MPVNKPPNRPDNGGPGDDGPGDNGPNNNDIPI
jgi:hypothetical protein